MRVVGDALFGVRNADGGQKLDGLPAPLLAPDGAVRTDRLDQLVADAVKRVQRRQRVLEDIGDVAAAHPAQAAIGRADQVLSLKMRGTTRDDAGGRGDKPHDRQRRHRLARSAFADDAKAFALGDMQVHAADRTIDAVLDVKLGLKPLHLKQPRAGRRRQRPFAVHPRRRHRAGQGAGLQPRVKRVAHPVAKQVDRHHDDKDHQPRHDGGMRVGDKGRSRLTQHGPEIRLRRLRAKAKEGQPRRFQDHPADGRGHGDHDDGDHVRQDLRQYDPRVRQPGQPRGIDKFLVRDANRDAPDVAGKERDVDGRHRDQRVEKPRPQRGNDRECQQDVGKGHQHIDAAHDQVVGPPAIKPRNDPDGRADGRRDDGRRETDGQRQPRPPKQPRQEVPAKVIRPQKRAFGKGQLEAVGGVGHVGIGQRQKRCDQRQQDHQRQDDPARQRQTVAREELKEPGHVLILGSRRLCATSTAMLKMT